VNTIKESIKKKSKWLEYVHLCNDKTKQNWESGLTKLIAESRRLANKSDCWFENSDNGDLQMKQTDVFAYIHTHKQNLFDRGSCERMVS
jgi:hypothetical protein